MDRDTSMASQERDACLNAFEEIVLPSAGLPVKSSYTISEVAKMFGVTTRTIYTYIRNGTCGLRAVRVRGSLRIFKEDLERAFGEMEVIDATRTSSDS